MQEGPLTLEPSGERKQATVLFADIVGSTELIAGLDAEDAMERLRPVVAVMAREVRRFDGTILRTLGDGIKAAFGAPRAQEGHAVLACQAALAMMDAVNALSGWPKLRIGIHSGEVVAGALDTGSAVEQEAQGLTVHLASRIEQLAEPGGICISRACRALVSAYCETVSLGPHTLRGISETVDVYRLISLRPSVASDQFRGSDLAAFRGRAEELALLREALNAAEQGTPSIIGLSAPAGFGKSRLCFEFGEWCRNRQVRVIEARAHVFGQATPLQPVLEMLRSFLRIAPFDEPAKARENIVTRLQALDAALLVDVPTLCDFLGIVTPEADTQRFETRTRNARLRRIIQQLIRTAGRRPSVIIIEDLHWLDEASCDFLEAMVEAVHGTQTVMVLNFRPTWSAGWMEQKIYREVRLAELDADEIYRLVRDLLGDATELAEVVSNIAERSGGNPFFAEELVRSLAQSNVLVGQRGNYRLAPSGWQNPVLPETVEAVIGARLDRLSDDEKSVLQIGAVIGKEFSLDLIRDVAGMPAHQLPAIWERLSAAELIQPRNTAIGSGFAFRHPLMQEVAYAMQLRTRRTRLHEAVARAMERASWGRLDEFASLLAHHWEAAGHPLEAANHLQRAALWLGRTNSSRALADWKKVRWLLHDQSHSEAIDRLRALASGRILGFGWREGMTAEEAKPYAEEALRYARQTGDHKHATLLLGSYGRILAATGAVNDYIALAQEALGLAKANNDADGIVVFYGMLGQAYTLAGLLRDALSANDAALEAIEAQGTQQDGVVLGLSVNQLLGFDFIHWVRCLRARILINLGQFDEADLWLPRVLQVDPARLDPVVHFIPHAAAVELAWHRGDMRAATRHANEVTHYAEQTGMPYLQVIAFVCQGLAALTLGDFTAAADHFTEALTAARRASAGLEYEAKMLALLADAHCRTGQRREAVAVSHQAIEAASRRTDRLAECLACLVAAQALPAAEQREANGLIDRAARLIDVTGAEIFRPMLRRLQSAVDMVGYGGN